MIRMYPRFFFLAVFFFVQSVLLKALGGDPAYVAGAFLTAVATYFSGRIVFEFKRFDDDT